MSGPMNWDASRVSAAIPSGVGFLGAGLIWKGSVGVGENEVHQVHGLTTAASVWLSAAVGVGVGGKMYFISTYCVALIIGVLRFGPRMYGSEDSSYNDEEETSAWDSENSIGTPKPGRSLGNDLDDQNRDDEIESEDEEYSIRRNMSQNDLNADMGGIGMSMSMGDNGYGSVEGGEKTSLLKVKSQSSVSISGMLDGQGSGMPMRRIKKTKRKGSATKKMPSFHS